MARRGVRKLDYNARIAATKLKPLEGTYRIIYADPPWKYFGLTQDGVFGHAEHHYDCLTDEQLCEYRPGDGNHTVKELADKDAVLFLWVTSPILAQCFPVIEAWGFKYKTHFVWDKVRHNLGHYNSMRHELLMICTRGTCTPDISKRFDSVQTIKGSDKHSEKPEEFYEIIESMYDHGRKLELFARKSRPGWDCDGNEATSAEEPLQSIVVGKEAGIVTADGDTRKLPDKVTVNGQPMDIGRLGPAAQAQIAEALNQNGFGKEAAA